MDEKTSEGMCGALNLKYFEMCDDSSAGLRLEEMEGGMAEVQQEITTLQAERAGLLAQLEKVELALTKAQAKRVGFPLDPFCILTVRMQE